MKTPIEILREKLSPEYHDLIHEAAVAEAAHWLHRDGDFAVKVFDNADDVGQIGYYSDSPAMDYTIAHTRFILISPVFRVGNRVYDPFSPSNVGTVQSIDGLTSDGTGWIQIRFDNGEVHSRYTGSIWRCDDIRAVNAQ